MRRILVVLLAMLAGATYAAASKRGELADRLNAFDNDVQESRSTSDKIAQWLNHNTFDNFNNWYNY